MPPADPGYACIHSNNVSWKNATTPAIKEVNPRIVFDRLFGGAKASDRHGDTRDQQETYINYDGLVMSNLWLSLMDRMGVVVERHGDSTGRLPALSP